MKSIVRLAVVPCAVFSIVAPAHAYQLFDSLREGDAHAGNLVGGRFTPDGWVVDNRTDRIWFEIPTLAEGSIEFTVTNMSIANLLVNDNEIFAMYEAGFGMVEPIDYSPEYRENDYKCMIRIYGQAEADRTGGQKVMWGICPSGSPGYHSGGCPCADSFFDETWAGDRNWDGSPQVLKVSWGGGVTRYYRNGGEVFSIDWSGSGLEYGPQKQHFSLGSPRAQSVGSSGMPVGAVFSDVRVSGTEGPHVTCGGEADAGTPDAGGWDAGTVPGRSTVTEDNTVYRSKPDLHPPDETVLDVAGDTQGQFDEGFYLKFDVRPPAGEVVSNARIRLYAGYPASPGSAEGGGGEIYLVPDNNWSEKTITWNNKPAWAGSSLSAVGHIVPDEWYAFDVTPAVSAPGVYSFAVLSKDNNGGHYLSKEGGATGGKQPYIEFSSVPGAGTDGGPMPGDGGDTDAGDDAAVPSDTSNPSDTSYPSDVSDSSVVLPDAATGPKDGGPAMDTGPGAGDRDASGAVAGDASKPADGNFDYDTLGCGCTTIRL